ncbi:TetR family transcriptional regulator [Comamonas faecalis]|uniref:TetR family transcriptional regulator n=1 Tax=Comamonas faecalis TaxID=1387849 RepID=A0ABP7QQD2_9BURK
MARRTKEDADATRNRLLDAAECVFHEKGVSKASLNDIAQAAGATRGAIYWHFKDKFDLLDAVMERLRQPLTLDYLDVEPAPGVPALECLRAMIDGIFATVEGDAHLRRVLEIAMFRVEYVGELSAMRERHLDSLLLLRERFARNLQQASLDAGVQLPIDIAAAAIGLQGLFDGLLQAWILSDAGFTLRAHGRGAVDAYLRGLGFAL